MKIVQSDIEGFKGRVTFKSPLHLEEVFAIEDALDKAAEVEPSAFWTKVNEARGKTDETISTTWTSKSDRFYLEAILKCTERFEIEGIEEQPTLENFPMTPRNKAIVLVAFLWDELQKIYSGETSVPNAS